ncbi:MAG TPA: glycosyltransferase [Planctomycetota bacterium]|nr:glycosyltransferase [Planctomycetota bacterium]
MNRAELGFGARDDCIRTDLGLRVGFDYWPAATHAPGVGRYMRELVRALAALSAHEGRPSLALLDVGPEGEDLPEAALGLPRNGVLRRRWRAKRGWLRLLEGTLGMGAETWLGKISVFHRAHLIGPPNANAPQIVALAQAPQESDAAVRGALARMAGVLVFNEYAKRALTRGYGLAAERVHVVPVGCDHWLRDLPAATQARERARILVLGAVRAQRGQVEILRAFERLRGGGLDADLVICGRRGDDADRLDAALRSSPVRRDVRWIDEPLESAMPELVAGSTLLVHLARDEWTAVTPLEAMSLGVAVVASRLPSFVEAMGELADYVEADPAAAIDVGLDQALARGFAKAQDAGQTARRRDLASRFTWKANACSTLRVYEQIARTGAQSALVS